MKTQSLVVSALVACLAALPLALSVAQEGPGGAHESEQPSPPRPPRAGVAEVDPAAAAPRAGLLRSLRFSLVSDEAQVVSGTQVLSGRVRLEVHAADGSALLSLHADRAERAGDTVVVTGNVRVETPEQVPQRIRATGLGSLLESNGLELSKAVLGAQRVRLQRRTRTVEIEGLDARAGSLEQGEPHLSLKADRVCLVFERGSEWRTRVSRLRVRLRLQ